MARIPSLVKSAVLILAAAAFISGPTAALAQDPPPAEPPAEIKQKLDQLLADADSRSDFTVDECVALTLIRSPDYESAQEAIEQSVSLRRKAITGFLPKFDATYSATHLGEVPSQNFGGRNIRVGDWNNYQLQATVSQPVFTGLATLTAYQLADLGLDASDIQKIQTKLDLIFRVKQTYYNVLAAEKNLEVAQQSVKQLEAHLEVSRNFFQVGMSPKNDVLRAEVRLAEAVQQQTLAENNLQYLRSALNSLMRRPLDAPLELADVQEITAADFDLDNATNQALEQRPEIHLAEIQIDVNRKNVQMARSDYYPVVSVQYQNTQAGDHPGLGGSQFTEAWQWNVAAVASWRFWDWGETYHDVQAKKRDVNIAQNDLKLLKDAVKLEVKQAYLNMNASKKNISVAKKAVEQAEESYRMSYERYREQVATNTELLDAETDLTQARINYYTALYDFNTDVAALQRAIGVDYYAAPPAPVEPAEEDSEPRGQ